MVRLSSLALLLAGTAGIAPLAAQVVSESRFVATIGQSATVDSNYRLDPDSAGTSTYTDTDIGLELLREGPTQSFALGLDTGLRALWEADEDFEFTFADPTGANAGYRNEWASGTVGVDLRYRQRNVDTLDDLTFSEVIVDDVIVAVPDNLDQLDRDVTERRYDANLFLALATDSPSSYRFDFRGAWTDYDNTSDTEDDLVPNEDLRGDFLWSLQLNPVLASEVLAAYAYVTTDDDTDDTVEVAELTAGLSYDVAEDFNVSFGLGYADRTRRQTIDGDRQTTEDDTGLVVRGGLRYAVAEDVLVAGNLRVSTAAPDTRTSGDLRADYALPRGALSARLSQDFTADEDGDEVRITTAGIGLTREINTLSSLSFDVAYGLQVNQDVDTADINRADFTATYTRAITEVVFADIGYRFRWRDEDDSATSNAVFVSLGRSFETGF